MARGWKRAAEVALARSGIARLAERRHRPSTLILAYHNIVPHGEAAVGDRSLHVDQSAFAAQLDFLSEHRSIVPLASALQRSTREPRVVITFDDAYRGTMTAGMQELERRSLPATVFVPPGLLGSPGFWWDRLAAPAHGGLDPRIREHALGALEGRTDRVLEWAEEEGLPTLDLPGHAQPVTMAELTSSLPDGIALGCHSWSHANLSALSAEDVALELDRSRDWLRDRTDRYVDWLAYPYGLHDPEVVEVAGGRYEGALLISGGHAEREGRLVGPIHRLPRVNVPRGLTTEGLALRLGGFLA